MKTIIMVMGTCTVLALLPSCNDADARYIDLNTGKKIELKEDAKTGLLVNEETRKPVTIYYDMETGDTIYGKTGRVINGKVRKMDDGRYVYADEERETGRQNDGEYAAKSGDSKLKITEDEYKIKRQGYKKEVEKDGDVTIKTGNKKIKIDGETGEKKVKYDD